MQEGGRIAFVAETPGTAIFDGAMCEGKAALVLRGRALAVEGLVFTHMRVEDGNGAGIRIEQGDLTVAYTRFDGSQCGILSADRSESARSRSTIRPSAGSASIRTATAPIRSTSAAMAAFASPTRRFERGTGGHYLKSRAPRVEILNNSFDDSQGRDTNYLIDLPEGAVGRIAGNTFVKGVGKENYGTLIAVHAEEGETPLPAWSSRTISPRSRRASTGPRPSSATGAARRW